MATQGDANVAAPAQPDPARPIFLELFFDLAYVFALIALAERLRADLTWAGAAETLLLLLAFTLVWAFTAWAGDTIDLGQPMIVPQITVVMAGSLLLAGAVPDAYGERGLLFAITYLVIHLGTSGYYLLVLPQADQKLRVSRVLFWESIAGVPWILGGLLPAEARAPLWAIAIAVEYTGVLLGWPAPWSRHRLPRAPRLIGERITERYRQFVIIALGVSLYLTGISFSQTRYTLDNSGALVVVFAITVLIWWIYIDRAGTVMTVTIARTLDPRISRFTAILHLVMVAGILGWAVGAQLVVGRPFGDTPPSWAAVIVGGPTLFLIGRLFLGYTVFAAVNRAMAIGLLLLVGLAPAAPLLAPVMVGLVVVVILSAVAAGKAILLARTDPAEPAPR